MMGTIITLTVKNLKTIMRDKVYLFFLLAMPIFMMILVGLAFRGGTTTYSVGYVNYDGGQLSVFFIDALENSSGLAMVPYNNTDSLKEAFRQGNIKGGLIIEAGYNPAKANETVTLFVDETDFSASLTIQSTVKAISQAFAGETSKEYWKSLAEPISVEFNMMNFMVVGTLSYAVSIILFSTAGWIAKERDKGTFSRLRTTPMSPTDFLAGGLLSGLIVSLIQAVSVFAVSYAVGFRPVGATDMDKFVNMLSAFFVAMLLAVASVGMGLIVAVFAKNEDHAVGISWFVIIPMMFLGGTWYEVQDPAMSQVSWAFPTTYCNKAIRAILVRGAPLASVSNYLAGLAAYAAILFMIGVLIFRKKTT